MIGIYRIVNPKGKSYIGQSINIEERWEGYKKLRCLQQRKLYNSFRKYKVENHIFEILEECPKEQLDIREIYWINHYKSLKEGLNLKEGGRTGKLSEESKNKIRQKLTGTKRSEKTKTQISQNMPSKKLFQYDLEGNLIKEWPSIREAQRQNKGNLKNNILGKTLNTQEGYIWLREQDKDKLQERLELVKNYTSPLLGKIYSKEYRKNLSNSIKGKKSNFKKNRLNLEKVTEKYNTLSTNSLAKYFGISYFTMRNYLKENNLYQFRRNYNDQVN